MTPWGIGQSSNLKSNSTYFKDKSKHRLLLALARHELHENVQVLKQPRVVVVRALVVVRVLQVLLPFLVLAVRAGGAVHALDLGAGEDGHVGRAEDDDEQVETLRHGVAAVHFLNLKGGLYVLLNLLAQDGIINLVLHSLDVLLQVADVLVEGRGEHSAGLDSPANNQNPPLEKTLAAKRTREEEVQNA